MHGPSSADADTRAAAFDRVTAVLDRARKTGLKDNKNGRVSGRVPPELIAAAQAQTGLQSDWELVEFALASIAIDDGFAQVFREIRGTVDQGLDLG